MKSQRLSCMHKIECDRNGHIHTFISSLESELLSLLCIKLNKNTEQNKLLHLHQSGRKKMCINNTVSGLESLALENFVGHVRGQLIKN